MMYLRTRALPGWVGVGLALALSGCGSGTSTPTLAPGYTQIGTDAREQRELRNDACAYLETKAIHSAK